MLPYQIATFSSWFIVGLFLFGSVYRTLRGKPVDGDEWKALVFFLGSLIATFSIRWVFWEQNIFFWKSLYVMSIGAALVTGLMVWNGKKR